MVVPRLTPSFPSINDQTTPFTEQAAYLTLRHFLKLSLSVRGWEIVHFTDPEEIRPACCLK